MIRIWEIPRKSSFKKQSFSSTNGANSCLGLWVSHKDTIWKLKHHPFDPQIVSVSADGTVKMWQEFDREASRDIERNSNDHLLGSFVHKTPNS